MTQEAASPYHFRPYIETDIPFIQSSWANSYYKGASYKDVLSPDEFNQFHRPIRERFLSRPSGTIIVCAAKHEDLIIGWCAVEKPKTSPGLILHYVYVKQAFKGEGIARELLERSLPESPIIMTHLTEKASRILAARKQLLKNFYYHPHLV